MQRIGIAIVAGVSVLGTSHAGAQNLLSNAGFEAAVNYDGNSSGNWAAFFGGAEFQMVESIVPVFELPPIDGTNVLQIGTFNTPDTFAGVVQQVGVEAGMEYEFSIFAREIVQNGINAEFRIEWVDAGGVVIGDQFALNTPIQDLLTGDFQAFSVSAEAPTGAVAANAVIAIATFGTAAPFEGFIQIDGTSFTKVPAPASLALLGMGAMASVRRRR
jgi:hypothetical protein